MMGAPSYRTPSLFTYLSDQHLGHLLGYMFMSRYHMLVIVSARSICTISIVFHLLFPWKGRWKPGAASLP